MPTYRFFWNAHKWTGVVLAVLLLNLSVTGMLLLFKKRAEWLQPPTHVGTEGGVAELASLQDVLAAVFTVGHPAFGGIDDIDRVDFRPRDRVHKVRSRHDEMEMQVDAVTGEILSVDRRVSDWLEDLHDGSWLGDGFHDYVMPVVPAGLAFLSGSGLYLWLSPLLRKRRRRTPAP